MKNAKGRLIAVAGATGHQGGAVLQHLRKRGFPCRALTRDPSGPKARALDGEGTEVVQADLDDAASLTRALDGAYGAFSVQTSRQGSEVEQGIAFAEAAARQQVDHFVYASVASADQNTGIPHFETKARIEAHVQATGLSYTIVRPVFFMENWLGMRERIEQGTLATPLRPETRLQMIAVDDIGGVTAAAFEHSGHWQGRTVELAGDELSITELAEAFSRAAGREVRYAQIPWEQFEKQAGADYTAMYRWFESTGYHVDIPALEREYPNLTRFEKWLHAHWTR
jgi:uncharacterized protein YbjT (DUF2867 family)